jgi:uncharacterized membrane protein
MAPTTRSSAQRRRVKSMARQTAYNPKSYVDEPPEDDEWDEDDFEVPAPRWPWIIGLILAVAGIGVASYLTYAHYTSASVLACPDSGGEINCAKVTTSIYSHILGFPVAVLGLIFFVGMIPLLLPVAWRSTNPIIRLGRLGASIVGVGMILWLIYAELFLIKNICIYCTAVHALTFLLFVVIALGTVATTPGGSGEAA